MGHWGATLFVTTLEKKLKFFERETLFVVSQDVRNSVYFSNNTGLWGWRRQVDRDFGRTVVLGGVEYDYFLPF